MVAARTKTLLTAVLLSCSSARGAPADASEFQARLAGQATASEVVDERNTPFWRAMRVPDPVVLVFVASRQGTDLAGMRRELEHRYTLTPAAADHLLAAILLTRSADRPRRPSTREDSRAAVDRALAAAAEAPDNVVPLGLLLAERNLRVSPELGNRLAGALDADANGSALALRLMRASRTLEDERWRWALAAYVIDRRPEMLAPLVEELGPCPEDAALPFRLAAFRAGWSLDLRLGRVHDQLGACLVPALLRYGQPVLALEVLAALPGFERTTLMTGRWMVNDIRVELAAAFEITSRPNEAETWLEAARAVEPPLRPDCTWSAGRDTLDRLHRPTPGADGFPLLLTGCSPPHPWALLMGRVLKAQYPQYVREQLETAVAISERSAAREAAFPMAGRVRFLRDASNDLRRGHAVEAARLRAELSSLPALPPAAGPEVAGGEPMPASQPFRETPVPAETDAVPVEAWQPASADRFRWPAGFRPVRVERSDLHVAAICLSQKLDPTGEVSGGGYWFLESLDGGERWLAATYLGLRHLWPYEIRAVSRIPMLQGSTLRLEAVRRQLDPSSVFFPPVALRAETTGETLLVAELDALRRDSDGDGLPDLVEERLLLDPRSPDTDGDGIPDGRDPLPRVPASAVDPDTEGELASAALFAIQGKARTWGGLASGDRWQGPSLESIDDILFVELDGRAAQTLRPSFPVIVVSHAELLAATRRFGPFYAVRVHVYLNLARDEALIVWDQHWRGGRFLARKRDGWTLELLGQWIT